VKLYRYIKEEYFKSFVDDGELRFSSLSFYKGIEDGGVRGDDSEGMMKHSKDKGLTLTNISTNEIIEFNGGFESFVESEDIYVLCFGTILSQELANDFQCGVCVEIIDVGIFF
jgi:hypothetical protein